MTLRLFATVADSSAPARVKHYEGFPPELTRGLDQRVELPRARIIALHEAREGVFLYRFAEDGSFIIDTWHASTDDAKHQAEFECGDALGEWRQMPEHIVDAQGITPEEFQELL